jgi:4-hydroxy-tetrahydrodipicolinate reductase
MIQIGIIGATGRMGVELIKAVKENSKALMLRKAICGDISDAKDNVTLFSNPNDDNGCKLETDVASAFAGTEAVLDFSSLAATKKWIDDGCAENYKGVILVGTSIDEETFVKLKKLGKTTRVIFSPNTSLCAMVTKQIVATAAACLPAADAEIIETHHNRKIDSPSGFALDLGRAIAKVRKHKFDDVANFGRHGDKRRTHNEIGFSSIRGGNIIGENAVQFFLDDEVIEIKHTVLKRSVFAIGALEMVKAVVDNVDRSCFLTNEDVMDLLLKNNNYNKKL